MERAYRIMYSHDCEEWTDGEGPIQTIKYARNFLEEGLKETKLFVDVAIHNPYNIIGKVSMSGKKVFVQTIPTFEAGEIVRDRKTGACLIYESEADLGKTCLCRHIGAKNPALFNRASILPIKIDSDFDALRFRAMSCQISNMA